MKYTQLYLCIQYKRFELSGHHSSKAEIIVRAMRECKPKILQIHQWTCYYPGKGLKDVCI